MCSNFNIANGNKGMDGTGRWLCRLGCENSAWVADVTLRKNVQTIIILVPKILVENHMIATLNFQCNVKEIRRGEYQISFWFVMKKRYLLSGWTGEQWGTCHMAFPGLLGECVCGTTTPSPPWNGVEMAASNAKAKQLQVQTGSQSRYTKHLL